MSGFIGASQKKNGVINKFTSQGITDNANANAVTIAADESVLFNETVTLSSDLVPSTALSNRNRLINGDFQVAQRGTSFTSTDSANNYDQYTLDRWYIISEGNNIIDVTQSTTAPPNQLTSIGLDVETANKKFGIAQIIENKNCVGLIGNTVTFSFKAKVSATTKLDNIKAGIIAWSGTADTVTSDVIGAWGADGTSPTLITNATYENTPANLNVTTSWATYSVSATIDTSSTTNLILFIWSDVLDTTAGHFLHITDCQIEQGSTATPFERISYGDELARCQRYYEKNYGGCTNVNNISYSAWSLSFAVHKRVAGTTNVYSTYNNAVDHAQINSGSDNVTATIGSDLDHPTLHLSGLYGNVNSANGAPTRYNFYTITDSEL